MAEEKLTGITPLAPGEMVLCVVEQIMPYGAFVRIKNGQRAMIHISELSHGFVKKVEDVLAMGQELQARVIKIDEKGRIDLSLKKGDAPRAAPSQGGSYGPRTPVGMASAPDDPRDSFEKKLSSYLKASEAKIADLNSKRNNPKASKKRGKPTK